MNESEFGLGGHSTSFINGTEDLGVVENDEGERKLKYFVYGVVTLVIGCIGLIGNLLCSIVLLTPKLRSHPINWYLLVLSICDSLAILSNLTLLSVPRFLQFVSLSAFTQYDNFKVILVSYLFPLHNFAYLSSVYLTILVALERFVSLNWPLKALRFSTLRNARWRSLAILSFFGLQSLPQLWYFNIVLVNDDPVTYALTPAEWVLSSWNQWYLLIVSGSLESIIPVVTLTTFNFLIYKKFKAAQIHRRELSTYIQREDESSPTKMLLVLVAVALVSTLIPFGIFVFDGVFSVPAGIEWNLLGSGSELVNSSVNFFIYCLWGKNFRTVFLALFCSWKNRLSIVETRDPKSNLNSGTQSTNV